MGQEVSAAAPAAAVMPMTPATIQRCVQLRLQLDAAPHGAGQALKAAACAETVMLPSSACAVPCRSVQAMVPERPWLEAVRAGVRVMRLEPVP